MNALDHQFQGAVDDAGVTRGNVFRALVKDAYLQVVDNLVFRILLILVVAMVLTTFAIGFRDDGVHVLFGVAQYDYEAFLGAMGWMFGAIGGDNRSETIVRSIQELFTTTVSGSFGALFAVVATSFFLPRMLEKGSADTLFSKPVGRTALVLSRYVASVMFVSILATVLVGGMYVGFAVSSGYTDPRFLWSAPMLIYLFVLLSAFSTFWGALTRSSIATLLLTVLSWWGCVGVHTGWMVWEYVEYQERAETAFVPDPDEPDGATDGAPASTEEYGPVVGALRAGMDAAHYVLPKTSDAARLTDLVRRTLHGRTRTLLGGIAERSQMYQVYERADGAIVVRAPNNDEAVFEEGRGANLELEGWRPVYLRVREDGRIEAWTASRRDVREAEDAAGEDEADPTDSVEAAWPPNFAEEAEVVPADEVEFGFEDPSAYLTRRFTWDEPDLGYNPVFSLLSSLATSALLVLLAIWRVRRLDF